MPYASPASAPEYVPDAKRPQWVNVWNSAYNRAVGEGKSEKDAESIAFREANGVALSERVSKKFSDIPAGVPKIPSAIAVYMELPGAQRDAGCFIVATDDGKVSMQHGCCDLWDDIPGERPANFQCGSCVYHFHAPHATHLNGSDIVRGGYLVDQNGEQHLPTTKNGKLDHGLMGAAWAALHGGYRGNKYSGPGKEQAISKLKALYHKEGMELPKAMTAKENSPRLFATSLVQLGELIDASSKTYKIPIAYPGTFYKDGEKFSITAADLHQIVKNFDKKETHEVNLDYEHASEIGPEISQGGPIPSAGKITATMVEPGSDGQPWLFGLVNYTDKAEDMVKNREYRFFSPAIDWSATDKSTGLPQGATLTTAALTNRPFLEKLPPLLMTEVPQVYIEPHKEKTMAETDNKKSLRLRKVTDGGGTHIHVHAPGSGEGEAAFGEMMGEIFPEDWKALSEGGSSAGETSSEGEPDMETKMGEMMGEGGPIGMTEVVKLYKAGKESVRLTEAEQGYKLLASTLSAKGWDKRKSRQLLSEGKVSPQQFAAFENAVEMVEVAIGAGKIHPELREYYLSDAIKRPADFEKAVETMPPYINLTENGLSGNSNTGRITASEREKTDAEVRQYMKDNKCTYTKALKAVTGGDRERGQRLREESQTSRTM